MSHGHIPGYDCPPSQHGITHSIQKLNRAAEQLQSSLPHIKNVIIASPCTSENETLGYRCSCSFQMVLHPQTQMYQYAMREQQTPIVLETPPYFPIALSNIQQLMEVFLDHVFNLKQQHFSSSSSSSSSCENHHEEDGNGRILFQYPTTRKHLSSVSFHSSWDESTNAFVTLNYSTPVFSNPTLTKQWKHEIQHMYQHVFFNHDININLTGVIGRSKKRKVVVLSSSILQDANANANANANDDDDKPMFLWDVIHPNYPKWISSQTNPQTNPQPQRQRQRQRQPQMTIQYRKPLDAFHHPNGKVMLKALDWILSKIGFIATTSSCSSLLELYCGCGAHTMPIAKLNLLSHIVAVEMDDRLVQACRYNWTLNNTSPKDTTSTTTTTTTLDVVKGDAADITRLVLQKKKIQQRKLQEQQQQQQQQLQDPPQPPQENKETSSFTTETEITSKTTSATTTTTTTSQIEKIPWYAHSFYILLVDPPRQGLDKSVCEFAIYTTDIQHMIYISCGRHALQRDLTLLGPYFEVKECCLMDLFPRTCDSVESLVHLVRRS